MQRLTVSSEYGGTALKVTRLWIGPGARRIGAVLGVTVWENSVAVCWDAVGDRRVWDVLTGWDEVSFPDPDFDVELSLVAAVYMAGDVATELAIGRAYLTGDMSRLPANPPTDFIHEAVSIFDLSGKTPQARKLPLGSWDASPYCLALTPDGRYVLALHAGRGRGRDATQALVRRDTAVTAGKPRKGWAIPVPTEEHESGTALAVSPDGERAAVGMNTGRVLVWKMATRKVIAELPPPKGVARSRPEVRRLTFSPDEAILAVLTDKRVKGGFGLALGLWSVPDGKPVGRVREKGSVNGVAFSPDGRTLLTACGDGTVGVWDTTTWKLRTRLDWGIGAVHSVAFAPDGLLAAAGGEKGQVVVWDFDV
jgi:WD40 repeat protein